MTKKATKLKEIATTSVKAPGRGSRTSAPDGVSSADGASQLPFLTSEAYGSDEQALHSLVSSITEKLGPQALERGQMHEFLSLILDTDPALKEEILKGIRERK
ncbi:MAG: hypothetical protein RL518_2576 [Pseudomonadota bacterium]|jgi:hypothetical protein